MTVRMFAWALGLTWLMAGCGGGQTTDANSGDCGACGDCNGSIRFHGVVYVVDTRLNQAAPVGRTLGPGAVVDCDHRTVVDKVVVSSVKGADSGLAIRIGRGAWHGVYVAENVQRDEWPTVLRHH